MKVSVFAAALGIILTSASQADQMTKCKMGTVERTVEIAHADETKKVPCEVKYHKEKAEPRVLWSAQNAAGYCEQKAADFIEKLTNQGWTCEEVGSTN